MPGGDGTGPVGMGPMTGRGAGYCSGYYTPGYANPIARGGRGFGYGRGFGRGRGRGFGRGFGFGLGYGNPYAGAYAAPSYPDNFTPKQEADMLKSEARAMQEEIDAINQRVKDIESAQASEADR